MASWFETLFDVPPKKVIWEVTNWTERSFKWFKDHQCASWPAKVLNAALTYVTYTLLVGNILVQQPVRCGFHVTWSVRIRQQFDQLSCSLGPHLIQSANKFCVFWFILRIWGQIFILHHSQPCSALRVNQSSKLRVPWLCPCSIKMFVLHHQLTIIISLSSPYQNTVIKISKVYNSM